MNIDIAGVLKVRGVFIRHKLLSAGWLVVFLFLPACVNAPLLPQVSRIPADRAVQEEDICKAVFGYLIKARNYNGSVFLSIDGKDPDDEFMARFTGTRASVKKDSGSYFQKNPFPGWLRDRSNGEKAVSLSIGAISWFNPTQVEVRGGTYCGGLCGDWGIFVVAKKNGEWIIEKYEVRGIS